MKLDFEKPEVDDGVNGILERGEVADLLFRVYNSGTLRGEGVRFALSTEDTLVSIISEPHFDVAHFNPSSGIVFSVRIQADRHTPWGHTASFLLTTTTLGDAVSVLPFDLQIGNKPVAVINLTTGSPSPEAMMTVLDSLAVPYDLLTEIPEEPVYTALFIILGTGNQTAHHLTTEEGVHLAAFLERGGRIYMEGYSTWYYQDDTPVHPLFRYTAEKIPVYTYPFVYGVPGTFTDGMQFLNTATVNYAIFALYPRGGSTVIMTNGNEETQNMQIAFDGDGYKTIASLPEFGCLDDSTGISTRHALMSEYLGFFDINVTGPWVYFHADRKTICQGAAVEFHDDSYDQIMTREWHFPGGTPEYSALPGPQVTYVEPGNYDVTLTVHDGVNTRTLTKHQYILAYNCVNSPEVTKVPELKVYPNPVTGRCFVSFSATPSGQMTIRLLDHMGRQYLNERIAGEINPYTIEMDLFPSGIYLLVVTGENWKSTVKVIKN